MSKRATESMSSKVNRLIGVEESYRAPERLMETLQDAGQARELFLRFLPEFGHDLSREWFNEYFAEEHADRKKKKQDFTPSCVSRLMAGMLGKAPQDGIIYEPAAGTGSTVIAHWWGERLKFLPWEYSPDNYLYVCEELSDRAVPFLLFNLMIRGMNAIVVHGNSLTREAKEVYHCDNKDNSFMGFSELRKLPHTEPVENLCGIRFMEKGGKP